MPNLSLEDKHAIIRETADAIKKLAAENKLADFLYGSAFHISFNANDTFGYACSEAVDIHVEDLPKMLEVDEKFGSDGINAFLAHVTEQDVLPELQTDKYKEAREYLKDYRPCTWIDS